jgi:hypothetical protein
MLITEAQLPFAKIVPISNNIYSKLSGHHEQLMLHFQVRLLKKTEHLFYSLKRNDHIWVNKYFYFKEFSMST